MQKIEKMCEEKLPKGGRRKGIFSESYIRFSAAQRCAGERRIPYQTER